MRQIGPYVGDDHGPDGGTGFINHNVEKLGITLNLRTPRGKELLGELVKVSDAVTENFAAGVMERLGFGYDQLRELRPDIVYVSNCGFGHTGPYRPFKSWGPIVQAVSGLTHTSALPDMEPAGWGYSYMDHTGGYVMGIALLAALYHRRRTGEGQWVDLACIEAGIAMTGPAALDATVNGRTQREPGAVHANRDPFQSMVPHGIYPAASRRLLGRHRLPPRRRLGRPRRRDRRAVGEGRRAGDRRRPIRRPGRARRRPRRVDRGPGARRGGRRGARRRRPRRAGGPTARALRRQRRQRRMGPVADRAAHQARCAARRRAARAPVGAPTGGSARGGPVLGEDNERVLTEVLGLSTAEIGRLAAEGVI